jgi:hypothetical protein
MPNKHARVASKDFKALAAALGDERWRDIDNPLYDEIYSPTFTENEAITVLMDTFNLTQEEATYRFRRLIRKENLVRTSTAGACPIVDIGEHAKD